VDATNQPATDGARLERYRHKDETFGWSHKASSLSGFNLVELMVAVAILAVSSAIVAPSFSTMSTNRTVQSEAHGILTGLELARTEAIYRNSNVSFTLNTGVGWTVATVSPVSTVRIHVPEEAGRRLRVNTLNDQTSVAFTPLGTVSRYSVNTTLTRITVTPPPGTDGKSLQIDVFPSGQVRMCNPTIAAADDPSKC
jgi:type IV fimbrial biogenesis protein FimT